LNISREVGVQLDNEHQYKHAAKLVKQFMKLK